MPLGVQIYLYVAMYFAEKLQLKLINKHVDGLSPQGNSMVERKSMFIIGIGPSSRLLLARPLVGA